MKNTSEFFNPKDFADKSTTDLQNYHARLVNWIASSQAGEKAKPWNETEPFCQKMLERREGLARIIAGRKVVESLKEREPTYVTASELSYKSAIRPLIPSLQVRPPSPTVTLPPTETTPLSPSPVLPDICAKRKRQLWEFLGVESHEEALMLLKEARQVRAEREEELRRKEKETTLCQISQEETLGESTGTSPPLNKKTKTGDSSLKDSSSDHSETRVLEESSEESEEPDPLLYVDDEDSSLDSRARSKKKARKKKEKRGKKRKRSGSWKVKVGPLSFKRGRKH